MEQHVIRAGDGAELYVFDYAGRHLQTLSTLTGAVLRTFEYTDGLLTRITEAGGLETVIERDAEGNPTVIAAPYGQTTALTVDAGDDLTAIEDPANGLDQFAYDTAGLMTTATDALGNTHTYAYDSQGLLLGDDDPRGGYTVLGIDTSGAAVLTTALGRTTTYDYARFRVIDHLKDSRDPTRIQTYTRRRVTDAAGLTTQSYKADLQDTTRVTTPTHDYSTSQGVEPRFRTPMTDDVRIQGPGGTMTVQNRRHVVLSNPDDPLSLVTQTDSVIVSGQPFVTTFDALALQTTTTTPEGRSSTTTIDSVGRVTGQAVQGMDPVSYGYDAQGRLVSASQGTRSWSFAYDAGGHLLSTTDPLGRSDSLYYDAADRVTRQVLRDGREIAYGYDAAGNLTSLAPPGRPAHTFAYNAVGLDSVYDPPDVPGLAEDRTIYAYNLDRDLTRITRPDGSTIDFAYDTGGRVDSVTTPSGVVDYAYYPTTGELVGITAPGGEALSMTYNRTYLASETLTGPVAGDVTFSYDLNARLAGLAVNGDTVAYGYDTDGLLAAAGDMVVNRDPSNGFLTSTALAGVTTRKGYNQYGEVSGDSAWANGVLVFARTYTRDDLGRITEVVDYADGAASTWSYGYDTAGRLETVTLNGSPYASYTYDANGNRLSRTSPAGVETGVYDAQDRMLEYDGATYSYTANGELSEKVEGADTTRYAYDVFGNLTRVDLPDGAVIEYVIDGRNRRVGKKVDGVLVQGFLYGDQLNPVAELDGAGNVVSRFVYGSKANVPDYMVRGGETYRILSDHLGSVRLVVNVSTGAVVQRMAYDAWGRVLEDTSPGWQPFAFAGGLWEAGTGLVRFGVRDYTVISGRWTANDPLGFGSRDTNLFGYVLNNPANGVDWTGLSATCVCEQSTGRLICIDNDTGETIVNTVGYSGAIVPLSDGGYLWGKNNPDMEWMLNVAPIPKGWWRVGAPVEESPLGSNYLPLRPGPNNDMAGREGGFGIHAERRTGPPGFASTGCIVAGFYERAALAKANAEGGGWLLVY